MQSTNGLKKKPLSVKGTSDNRLYVTDGLLISLTVLGPEYSQPSPWGQSSDGEGMRDEVLSAGES
jgi:hypothetical protein